MRLLLTALLLLFLLSASVSADGIKKVDQPQGIPSFLGYVPDRLIVVMKPDVGTLTVRKSANAVASCNKAEPPNPIQNLQTELAFPSLPYAGGSRRSTR